ncbi:RILP-like protein 2 [Myiozetetes cayanensis]|uniref:RILP-like protein 2 n=1 Tax=Myiozetetes cayanensis TaxID=478635 RepID=UPI00215E998A|nr:RILP-like protein 2 [Myiozetetes cayanensis]XP_050180596.1 RILP-like protein 2 [Myiozetetes cayanensis]
MEPGTEDIDGGPERALEKSPFQMTVDDVYCISTVLGWDFVQLSLGPNFAAARAQLQFRVLRVLEMLEALVSEGSAAGEQLRRQREALGGTAPGCPAAEGQRPAAGGAGAAPADTADTADTSGPALGRPRARPASRVGTARPTRAPGSHLLL